jgi:hypothetical protein
MAKGIKTGGRAKGTPNKSTAETREIIREFVNGKLENIDTLYNKLSPFAKMELITRLMPYTIGKLAEEKTENSVNDVHTIVVNFKDQSIDAA